MGTKIRPKRALPACGGGRRNFGGAFVSCVQQSAWVENRAALASLPSISAFPFLFTASPHKRYNGILEPIFPSTAFHRGARGNAPLRTSRLPSPAQSNTMRTLNVRRTVVFLIVAIVVAGSAHLLHSYQLQRNSTYFKIQAEAAWNDNPRRILDALGLMRVYILSGTARLRGPRGIGLLVYRLPRVSRGVGNSGRIGAGTGEARPAGRGGDSKSAAEGDRCRPGPGAMRRRRVSPGDSQEGTAPRRERREHAGEVQDYAGARTARPSRTFPKASNSARTASTSITTRPWPCVFRPCKSWRRPRSAWRT